MQADLFSHFQDLEDPRVERTKRYPLMEIIFFIISATVSGCDGWKSIRDFGVLKREWWRRFLPYENGIPVDDTLARVMRKLNTKQFASCFMRGMKAVAQAREGDVIALDGKTLRRSYEESSSKSAIHMVSAWSSAHGVVLGQEKTAEKSNEITAIPELLKSLAIQSCLVTIDAMGCQKAIAEQIVQQKGEYLLALKGNQGHLHEEVQSFFLTAQEKGFKGIDYDFHEEMDAGHSRIETRRFYITSSESSAEKLLHSTRKHWGIENSLHWTLDVTFREDESRIRKEAAPENYAIFRHIALNLIRKNTSIQGSIKGKRHRAALDDNVRTTLIREFI